MSLYGGLTFAGYDKERSLVLLKGAFGALYHLKPIWNTEKGMVVNAETNYEGGFTESVCSESYVSSGSSSCSAFEKETQSGCVGAAAVADETCRQSDASLPALVSNPVHGTTLRLKEHYCSGVEVLPFAEVETDTTGEGVWNDYLSPVLLGYDRNEKAFMLPAPKLLFCDGVWTYRNAAPLFQLSLPDLHLYYSWVEEEEIDMTCGHLLPSELPLGTGCMKCPRLDFPPLRDVFGVTNQTVYYLSAWSVYVQFVGTAWGFPWVRVLPIKEVANEGDVTLIENNEAVYIEPLSYCRSERSLCEIYGLCECEQDAEELTTKKTVPPGSVDAANSMEGWRRFLRHAQNTHAGNAQSSFFHGTFNPHGVFSPRGSNYAAQLNRTSVESPPPCSLLFVLSNKVFCRGAFGVTLDCDLTSESLAKFGVLHGDCLVGTSKMAFEGRKATVLGVHMGCLVVALDGDRRATTLRGIKGSSELQILFSKVATPVPWKVAEKEVDVRTPVGSKLEAISLQPTTFRAREEEKSGADIRSLMQTVDAEKVEEMSCGKERLDDRKKYRSIATGNSSSLFTNFLKAVAFWKLGLLSEEEQLQQPLAFVQYYEVQTQKRMMDAVECFQRHGNLLGAKTEVYSSSSITGGCGDGSITSVQDILHLLVEGERDK